MPAPLTRSAEGFDRRAFTVDEVLRMQGAGIISDEEKRKETWARFQAAMRSLSGDTDAQRELHDEVGKLIVGGTNYEAPTPGQYPRTYRIRDPHGQLQPSYRIVLAFNSDVGQYYGVQGTTWQTPPVLNNPTQTRVVAGRKLLLYANGGKLTTVA